MKVNNDTEEAPQFQTTIEIKSVSMKKGFPNIDYKRIDTFPPDEEFPDGRKVESHAVLEGGHRPDKAFLKAFVMLRPHFALITEQWQNPELEDFDFDLKNDNNIYKKYSETWDDIVVTKATLGGDEDEGTNGVTLSGFRKLKSGHKLNMTAKFTKFTHHTETYDFKHLLDVVMCDVIGEAELYINGKYQPEDQLEFQFD